MCALDSDLFDLARLLLGSSPDSSDLAIFFIYSCGWLSLSNDYRMMYWKNDNFVDIEGKDRALGKFKSYIESKTETKVMKIEGRVHLVKKDPWCGSVTAVGLILNLIKLTPGIRCAGLCGETDFIEINCDEDVGCSDPLSDLRENHMKDAEIDLDNFVSNLRKENEISIANQARDESLRTREEFEELKASISNQIRQGAESLVPRDSVSRVNGKTSKGKMKSYDIDEETPSNRDLMGKIEMMREYIAKLESPKKAKIYYEDGDRSVSLGTSIDALTIFDTPHESYSKEDYEMDLCVAHENSGIVKIDGEWQVPRAPKTFSHTLIPRTTCDKWLNFLIRIHVALFMLLGTDNYPPADFMSKFRGLRKGKYSSIHPSMDLLQVVIENTIDFEKMIVKRNNFCLPLLEDRMRISESTIANCLICLLSEYRSRWVNLFKDCVIPTFVQAATGWNTSTEQINRSSRNDKHGKRRMNH
jgi:hypothetical protein